MGWKAHATCHGLSSPWVWDGPYAPPPAVRPLPDRVRSYTRPAIRGRPDMGWKAHATIGVETGIEPAPPSEPDRRVSRIRLSSW